MEKDVDDKKLKIVDFKSKKEEQEALPSYVIERLEKILAKAKSGQLYSLCMYSEWEENEEESAEEEKGGLILWNKDRNMKEAVADIETMKAFAMSALLGGIVEDY